LLGQTEKTKRKGEEGGKGDGSKKGRVGPWRRRKKEGGDGLKRHLCDGYQGNHREGRRKGGDRRRLPQPVMGGGEAQPRPVEGGN